MSNTSTKTAIESLLKSDNRLWNEDKTDLNQTLLIDLVENNDEIILGLLLDNPKTKAKFFVQVKSSLIFKARDFRFFMEENKVDNSYTAYKNKIGLTDGRQFIRDTPDVVLDYPFKDCVLEGGQTKDDTKRSEIFFNQVIARDEIDRLLDPKAFTGYKRYTTDKTTDKGLDFEAGKNHPLDKEGQTQSVWGDSKYFNRNAQGTITDNLIIKGNNLIALHSLKTEFRSKVKLIYIDPPYNTGSDSFGYNDRFNHSTWLVFMKNRLEVARELLRDDGVMAISIDENMQAYLKILLDEIFGKANYLSTVIVQNNSKGRVLDKNISTSHEYLFMYCKKQLTKEMKLPKTQEEIKIQYQESDERGYFRSLELRNTHQEYGKFNRTSLYYPIYVDKSNGKISLERIEGFVEVYPNWENGFEGCWTWGKEKSQKESNLLYGKITNGNYKIYRKSYANGEDGEVVTKNLKSIWLEKDFLTDKGRKELDKLIGGGKFYAPKPLEYIKQIINLITFYDKDAIILDYHTGSGTTGHAVLDVNKIDGGNRQFILVEQMDYAKDVTCQRIKKASEMYNYGGSYVYLELASNNESAKTEILACTNTKKLVALFERLYNRYYLNYNLKIKDFAERTIVDADFVALELDEQKRQFLEMLDLNQMYVHATEVEDKMFGVSKKDIAVTEEFYGYVEPGKIL